MTVTSTVTASVASAPAPTMAWEHMGSDEKPDGWVLVRMTMGPCIDPRQFQWEFSASDGTSVLLSAHNVYDSGADVEEVQTDSSWCVREVDAFPYDAEDLGAATLRVYAKSDGRLMAQVDIPAPTPDPWPDVAFSTDETRDRITIVTAESNLQWSDFEMRTSQVLRYAHNGNPTASSDATTTTFTPFPVSFGIFRGGDYLDFCSLAGTTTIEIRHVPSSHVVYQTTLNTVDSC